MKIQEHYTFICENCEMEFDDETDIFKCPLCKNKEICEDCSFDCEECKRRVCEYHILYYNLMNVCHACVIEIQDGERLYYHDCTDEAVHLGSPRSIFICAVCEKNKICINCTKMCPECLYYGWCKDCNKVCPHCKKPIELVR